MTPEELAAALQAIMEGTLEAFNKRMITAQNRALNGLIQELMKLDRLGQTIKPTMANLKRIERVKAQLARIIFDEKYNTAVGKFAGEFTRLQQQIDTYMLGAFGNAFKAGKPLFEQVVSNAMLLTRDSLFVSHVEGSQSGQIVRQFLPGLEEVLNTHVTTGARYSDLLSAVRTIMIGDGTRGGQLARYSKLFARDAVGQFTRNYMQTVAQGSGAVVYLYSGGTVEDTRDFCLVRTGKYWHEQEIRAWGSTPANWQGRIPTTNSSTIFSFLGGFNCMHTLIAAHVSSVPKSDRERMEAKGLLEPLEAEEETTTEEAGRIAPDGWEFAPDVPDAKFTFGGKRPKGFEDYPDMPDQLFEGWGDDVEFIKKGHRAYYQNTNKTVNVPTQIKRWGQSRYWQRQVVIHESAHAKHTIGKIVTNDFLDDGFVDTFKQMKSILRKKIGNHSEIKSHILRNYTQEAQRAMSEKMGIKARDWMEMYSSMADAIMGLTNGNAGWGHTKKYMKTGHQSHKEVFAHMAENLFVGNPVFKELFPDIYKLSIDYARTVYGI